MAGAAPRIHLGNMMKAVIPRGAVLGGFTCALLACQTPNAGPEVQDLVQQNVELAQKAFATFNAHDWSAHANCFSDDCKNLDPSLGSGYVVMDRKEKEAKYVKLN